MADATPGSIERRMLENAKIHVRESGQFRTARDLAGLFGLDLSEFQSLLKGWKARSEIFSINDESAGELFPVFAFDRTDHIRPFDALAKVLFIFGDSLSEWAIASWFIGLNSYLDDQCPKDLIGIDPGWVIEAARDGMEECSQG